MTDARRETVRPASVEDLKLLLRALDSHNVDYLLIGGYALYTLGYQRGTTDIDVILRPTEEQGERVKQALLLLPDRVCVDLMAEWFTAGETIRVVDAFVVDLMFDACGEPTNRCCPTPSRLTSTGFPFEP